MKTFSIKCVLFHSIYLNFFIILHYVSRMIANKTGCGYRYATTYSGKSRNLKRLHLHIDCRLHISSKFTQSIYGNLFSPYLHRKVSKEVRFTFSITTPAIRALTGGTTAIGIYFKTQTIFPLATGYSEPYCPCLTRTKGFREMYVNPKGHISIALL